MGDQPPPEGKDIRAPGYSIFAPEKISVTAEDTYSGHVIRDDQLAQLERGATDQSLGWAQCLLGGGIGLFQNVIALMRSLWIGGVPAWHDALLAIMCGACFAAAFALMYTNRNRKSDINTMCRGIRERKKKLN
jgi:hypothetical protein